MSKKVSIFIKIFSFFGIFYVLCMGLACLVRDDVNSYTRVLMHDLHSQKKVDVIICGASHVSHGLLPSVMDEEFSLSTFCTGTPNQDLDGSLAIIKECKKMFDVKKVYLELDFATAKTDDFWNRKPEKNRFLVGHYLKDPKIRREFLLQATHPKYYLNTILPIGVNSLVDLNPKVAIRNIKSRLTGEYYKYEYKVKGSTYGGKGCILDEDFVENGTFSSKMEGKIFVTDEWKKCIAEIADYCRKNEIELILMQNPSTDFYLTEKGNYDEYISWIREIAAKENLKYYDFSLCKPEFFYLEDEDFSDDNHLNVSGIKKFTKIFCDFFNGKYTEEELFYNTFAEKQAAQKTTIYGLMLDKKQEKNMLEIIPIMNHGDTEKITYTVKAVTKKGEILIQENSSETKIHYPENSMGKLIIESFYDGEKHNTVTEKFAAL